MCAHKVKRNPNKIVIALVGKTGHGKSSTGNTILGHPTFDESPNADDATQYLQPGKATFGNYTFEVYDLPGVISQGLTEGHVQRELEKLKKKGKIDVFIFVFSYSCRFTAEEAKAFSDLQKVFGNDFLDDQGMIVCTHGDNFEQDRDKSMSAKKAFSKWCENSGEKFQTIKRMVGENILLVNNKGPFEKKSARLKSSEEIRNMAIRVSGK